MHRYITQKLYLGKSNKKIHPYLLKKQHFLLISQIFWSVYIKHFWVMQVKVNTRVILSSFKRSAVYKYSRMLFSIILYCTPCRAHSWTQRRPEHRRRRCPPLPGPPKGEVRPGCHSAGGRAWCTTRNQWDRSAPRQRASPLALLSLSFTFPFVLPPPAGCLSLSSSLSKDSPGLAFFSITAPRKSLT